MRRNTADDSSRVARLKPMFLTSSKDIMIELSRNLHHFKEGGYSKMALKFLSELSCHDEVQVRK